MEKKKIKGFVNVAVLTSLAIVVMAVLVWQLRQLPASLRGEPTSPATTLSQPPGQITASIATPAAMPQTEENVKAAATQTATISLKEIYIPLGQGESTAKEWKDVGGAEVYIDTSKYPEIDSVVFEAALHMSPSGTGTAYARLRNVTDGPTVWFSDLSTTSVTSTLLQSQKIFLTAGKKLYRVQMYATHGYPAILDFARIKVVLK